MTQLEQLIATVRTVAAQEVMPRFQKVGHGRKQDGSLFTEADLASQHFLSEALPQIAPHPVLGEEMSDAQQAALWAANPDGLWVVDPIDGTTNFVNGLPQFAVSVALMRHGRSELGVVYNPVSDELFAAQRGHGATLNDRPLPLRHISASQLHDALAAIDLKYVRSGRLASRLLSVAPFASQRNYGSSTLDWCYLAAGRFDVYLHGGQKLWDYAAGALIFEEAGGTLTDVDGAPFWDAPLWQRPVLAALDATVFRDWLNWVRANQ